MLIFVKLKSGFGRNNNIVYPKDSVVLYIYFIHFQNIILQFDKFTVSLSDT